MGGKKYISNEQIELMHVINYTLKLAITESQQWNHCKTPTNANLSREHTNIDTEAMLQLMVDQAQEVSGHPISNSYIPWKHNKYFHT